MKFTTCRLLATLAVLLVALPAAARPGGQFSGRHRPPAFLEHLYPPDLVMRHQHEIDLSSEQREAITEAIQKTQAQVIEAQWLVQDEERKLSELLGAMEIDEEAAFAQARRLMELEQKLKLAHLGLLISIRNRLTSDQRDVLDTLRPVGGPPMRGGGP